jgi:hypothetical protein
MRLGDKLKALLPDHTARIYDPVGVCIYCGSSENLGNEHIIPLGLGGRMVLPKSSCKVCSGRTSAFEGTCLRTMFGPLRMLYDLPSRRKRGRPRTLPLKVKRTPDDEWTELHVSQEDYPFLVLLPRFPLPDLVSGVRTIGARGPAARVFWIRGASASLGFFDHLEELIAKLGLHSVMPRAKAQVREFCLMLAKVGHSFATAELGYGSFEPLLTPLIVRGDLSNCVDVIGGLSHDEPPSLALHEMSLEDSSAHPDLVVVRVRLLSRLGTPTYYVVAGCDFSESFPQRGGSFSETFPHLI